jgi:hypothetical protein
VPDCVTPVQPNAELTRPSPSARDQVNGCDRVTGTHKLLSISSIWSRFEGLHGHPDTTVAGVNHPSRARLAVRLLGEDLLEFCYDLAEVRMLPVEPSETP